MIENVPEVVSEVMPVTTGKSEQVAIRLPHEAVERTKAVRSALTRPGLEAPSMAEILRAVVLKGLDAWELELGLSKPAAPRKKAGKR